MQKIERRKMWKTAQQQEGTSQEGRFSRSGFRPKYIAASISLKYKQPNDL